MGKVIITTLLFFTLVGCANRSIQDQLTFCEGAQPLRPAQGETAKLSDQLVDQIDQHNTLGSEACGWKP